MAKQKQTAVVDLLYDSPPPFLLHFAMHTHKSEDRTTAENDLKALVIKMLSTSYTHEEINDIVRTTVLGEAAKLPPRRVLYNATYGGFGFSEQFTEYLAKDPATSHMVDTEPREGVIIQAITDFGREICTNFPFILEDLKTVEKWKLNDLMNPDAMAEPHSDLANRLASFRTSLSPSSSSFFSQHQRISDVSFIDYIKTHPEKWMLHQTLFLISATRQHARNAVQFAHQLLRDAPEMYRDQEASTGNIDAQVYESIGLAGASGIYSVLCLDTVPAMVDYTITEYDGFESVKIR